jgi:hypothetical protein
MQVKFRELMVNVVNTLYEAEYLLDDIEFQNQLVKRVLSKEEEKSRAENRRKMAERRQKKRARSMSRKDNTAYNTDEIDSPSLAPIGVPIRKFVSFGTSTSTEINKKVQSAVSEVSRLTEDARAIMATIQQSKPHIRRMPVSKLATPQALNQTLGYAIQEILHLTEEARTIMVTIQQRKRQTSWRFIRRWGRDTIAVPPVGSGTSPTDLLAWAHRNLRSWSLGTKYLKKQVNIINTLIRQRKRAHGKPKPRIIKQQRLRVRQRQVRPRALNVVHYPSQSWVVHKVPVNRESRDARLVRLRQSIADKKSKRDGLAQTVESWLTGGGSYANGLPAKSGFESLLESAEQQERRDAKGARQQQRRRRK